MAFAFFGMNAVGVEIENPFGDDDNDLPIKKMMKRIELDTGALLEMRGISDQAVRQETEKKTAPFFKRAIELSNGAHPFSLQYPVVSSCLS
jgi:hypothetical protein